MGRGLILIRQLACRGRLSSKCSSRAYPVLAVVSNCYPGHEGRLSTRYSPVRHSTHGRSRFRVRLACVKHAASVQSEPESNSPVQICSRSLLGRNQNLKDSLFPLAIHLSMNHRPLSASPLFLSGAVQVYAPFPNPCQQLFFVSRIFFRCSGKVPAQSREMQSSRTPINCQSLFYNFFCAMINFSATMC